MSIATTLEMCFMQQNNSKENVDDLMAIDGIKLMDFRIYCRNTKQLIIWIQMCFKNYPRNCVVQP